MWQFLRESRPWPFRLAGALVLISYGVIVTFQADPHFGRVYAAYGGIFIVMALAWGYVIDGFRPDRWEVAQLLFTPLLAVWSIWVGIGVSARSSDIRVAQQLGLVASLPPVFVVLLIALNVIPATPALAVGGAALLLVLDGLGWWVVGRLFDRERLITETR